MRPPQSAPASALASTEAEAAVTDPERRQSGVQTLTRLKATQVSPLDAVQTDLSVGAPGMR